MKSKTFQYGKHSRNSLDVYFSKGGNSKPVIIFWHGGSWKGGDKRTFRFVGRSLVRLGYNVVIPNYRLYPDVKFPSFVEDGALAVSWVTKKFPDSKIILMGHSAGAHIAALLTFENKYLKRAKVDDSKIAGLIGISGPYNFSLSPSIKEVFAESPKIEWNPCDRVVKPKPAMLIYGERDKVVLTSNSEDLYQKLRMLGGKPFILEYPLLGHISILLPFIIRFIGFEGLKSKVIHFIEG